MRHARLLLGMTTGDVALKVHVTPDTVGRLERNLAVNMYTFIELCKLYNISIDGVIYGTQADWHRVGVARAPSPRV